MLVGESAWHVDFFGAFNTPLTRSVSLNFPQAPTFAKVALTRYVDDLAGPARHEAAHLGDDLPITKSGNGNVYVLFDASMINVVFGGTANNASGTFRWTLETWS
jgi:hypothetical protein